ncbi:hypothetical protein H9L39_08168 [Fusarium oxysporum f. sp. albedinis]|nr:hypothetical protein H9L39_08168 [Fusarium oxysporum f. sp. albedinis]
MADLLSPVLQAANLAIQYFTSLKDARDEQKLLCARIKDSKELIQQLQVEAKSSKKVKDAKCNINALVVPEGPISRLIIIFKAVIPKVKPERRSNIVLWHFRKQDVADLMSAIDDENDLLALALHIRSIRLTTKIDNAVQQNQELLRNLLSRIGNMSRDIKDDRNARHREEILNWLTPMGDTTVHDKYCSERTPGTGEWILKSTEYNSFLNSKKGTLFCQGIPGAGKTFLTSTVIDDLMDRAERDENVCIAYIYCDYGRGDEQDAHQLLAYILKRLSAGKSPIPDDIKQLCSTSKNKGISRPSFDQTLSMLGTIIAGYREVFVVVDAIDKMSDTARSCFLDHLSTLQKQHNLKLFATYRHVPTIVQKFWNLFSITIQAHRDDVHKYVEAHKGKLPAFVRRRPDLMKKTKEYITQAADGMFLLAQRHLDLFADKFSLTAYLRDLRIPAKDSNVCDDIYEEIWDRIENQGANRVKLSKMAVSWIFHAQRPISEVELSHALAVRVDQSEFRKGDLPDINTVISSCFGILIVDSEKDVIRLAHYSLRKFLERKVEESFPGGHKDITTTCITYLSLKGCGDGFFKGHYGIQKRQELYPFYEYAANNWGHHARKWINRAQSTSPSQAKEGPNPNDPYLVILAFLKDNKKLSASNQARFATTLELPANPKDMDFGAIHTAASFGLVKALEDLLQNHDLNMKDWLGRTPLWVAAENGHAMVVQRLLNTPQATDMLTEQDETNEDTPLSVAVRMGHTKVVKILLAAQTQAIKEGLILDSSCLDATACLPIAAIYGHLGTLQLLLDEKADPTVKNLQKRTALFAAAYGGNEKIIKELLKYPGIIVCAKDTYSETPLWWAVSRQNIEAARHLLTKSLACINLQNHDLNTPLHEAAKHGNQAICELLLKESSINPNLKNKQGETPLWLALRSLDVEVIKALMSKPDLDITCRNADHLRPVDYLGRLLSVSSKAPKAIKVIKLLLQHKDFNVNFVDAKRNTVLHYAASKGDKQLITTLKEDTRLSLNPTNKEGRTPLSIAAELGFRGAVKELLVEDKIKPDLADNANRTPLSWAAGPSVDEGKNKHGEIVSCLLAHKGVDVNSMDKKGRSPLSHAAASQTADAKIVMKALLKKKGIDVNLKDKEGRTPLFHAAQHGNTIAVKLLVEAKSVDVKAVDSNGRSALQFAQKQLNSAKGVRKEGFRDIVQMLEDCVPAKQGTKEKSVRKEFEHRRKSFD